MEGKGSAHKEGRGSYELLTPLLKNIMDTRVTQNPNPVTSQSSHCSQSNPTTARPPHEQIVEAEPSPGMARRITHDNNDFARAMQRREELGKRDGDTIGTLLTLYGKPEGECLPYQAALATIGYAVLDRERKAKRDGPRAYAAALKLGQRRVHQLASKTQPRVGRLFVGVLPDPQEQDAYSFLPYLLYAADEGARRFRNEGRKSKEWRAASRLRTAAERREARERIKLRFVDEALATLPKCDARLINPDGEPRTYTSTQLAIQFCTDNPNWHWLPINESPISDDATDKPKRPMTSDDLKKLRTQIVTMLDEAASEVRNGFGYDVASEWLAQTVKAARKTAQTWAKVEGALGRAKENHLLFSPLEEEEEATDSEGGHSEIVAASDLPLEVAATDLSAADPLDKMSIPSSIDETANPASDIELSINKHFKTPAILTGNYCFGWVEIYARAGWEVLPVHALDNGNCTCKTGAECATAAKHPRIMGGAHAATRDLAKLATWWAKIDRRTGHAWAGSNVGIATGEKSGFLVLDFDGQGGAQLYDEWGALGWLPETREAITQSGSRHVLLKYFHGLKNGVRVAPGLDVRTDGGLIVVEPSRGVKGDYRWVQFSTPIAEAPLALREHLLNIAAAEAFATANVERCGTTSSPQLPSTVTRPVVAGAVGLGDQSSYRRDYPHGVRNRAFYDAACAMRGERGASREQILAELRYRNSAVQSDKLTADEIETIVTSACKHPARVLVAAHVNQQ